MLGDVACVNTVVVEEKAVSTPALFRDLARMSYMEFGWRPDSFHVVDVTQPEFWPLVVSSK